MISVVTITNKSDPHIYRNIFNNYLNQSYVDKELILIINRGDIDKEDSFYRHSTTYNNNGIDIYRGVLDEILKERKATTETIKNNIRIYKFPANTLGDCLNKSAFLANGKYWSKFDDDDKYGSKYLENSLLYLRKSGADMVGKRRVYIQDKQTKSIYLTNSAIKTKRETHKMTDFVRGPTFFCPTMLVLLIRFPSINKGEDTEFLRRCVKSNKRIYTSDENDFVYIRNSNIGQTSTISLEKILGNNYTKLR